LEFSSREGAVKDKHLYDQASEVSAEEGRVHVNGPDGVAVALTPEAAFETADRLTDGAAEAAGQRHFMDRAGKKQPERYDQRAKESGD
jgi:hypothetical protein